MKHYHYIISDKISSKMQDYELIAYVKVSANILASNVLRKFNNKFADIKNANHILQISKIDFDNECKGNYIKLN